MTVCCDIQPWVLGSDHCPVSARLSLSPLSPARPPAAATKFYPEFAGTQAKLSDFFSSRPQLAQPLQSKENAIKKRKVSTSGNKSKITNFFSTNEKKNVPEVSKDEALARLQESEAESPEKRPKSSNNNAKTAWGAIFRPPPPAPLCSKHKEEAVRRRVGKKGPNQGREFWCCARGEGRYGTLLPGQQW